MKINRRYLLVLVIIAALALPATAAAAGPCATTGINVREGPGGGYARTGIINRGECITVLGLSPDGNWYQIPGGFVWAAPHLWTNTGSTAPAPVSGPAPVPVGTHKVTANSWVSDTGPAPGQAVVAFALIAIDGAARAGIPVDFAWGTGAGAFHCSGVSDELGAARCLHFVGGETAGAVVPVVGSFRAYGQNYTTATSYVVNGDCNQSYPDFCLPNGLPPQSCASIPYRNFLAIQPDPHGFDPDGNGIGCEA